MGEPRFLRFLAPVAVIVALVAVVVIVGTVNTGSSSKSSAPTVTTASRKGKPASKFYVVKRGDTLSAIASKTGVSIRDIEDLNPNLDPQTVRPGQRLRIRR